MSKPVVFCTELKAGMFPDNKTGFKDPRDPCNKTNKSNGGEFRTYNRWAVCLIHAYQHKLLAPYHPCSPSALNNLKLLRAPWMHLTSTYSSAYAAVDDLKVKFRDDGIPISAQRTTKSLMVCILRNHAHRIDACVFAQHYWAAQPTMTYSPPYDISVWQSPKPPSPWELSEGKRIRAKNQRTNIV